MRCFRPRSVCKVAQRIATSNIRSAQSLRPPQRASFSPLRAASFHGASTLRNRKGHNNEIIPDGPPTTDFSRMDMLGEIPIPATSVDVCMSDGFALNSGTKILNGSGAVLVDGEAFEWRPWTEAKTLVNSKGQWEVPAEAFGLFSLVWPRPDLLILGVGPEIRPLSPETRRLISSLGMRVEILDTRNAASQFNLLATERGVSNVAAALIPIGWKEGVGAS